jgi:hypothetical protein
MLQLTSLFLNPCANKVVGHSLIVETLISLAEHVAASIGSHFLNNQQQAYHTCMEFAKSIYNPLTFLLPPVSWHKILRGIFYTPGVDLHSRPREDGLRTSPESHFLTTRFPSHSSRLFFSTLHWKMITGLNLSLYHLSWRLECCCYSPWIQNIHLDNSNGVLESYNASVLHLSEVKLWISLPLLILHQNGIFLAIGWQTITCKVHFRDT